MVADGEASRVVLLAIEHRLSRHGQSGGDILRLGVGEQSAVKLHRRLTRVVVAHRVAHRHDRRHAPLKQCVGSAGVARLIRKIEVLGFGFFDTRPLGTRLLPLSDREEVIPILHPQDVAGVTGT